ncbi:MAG: tRNA 2-thiouridine(34) synthase MnmA [Lachnospiraceae bacterium]|nr:tRNA 2-thiouridine(34) synthase MnmA [Lachnospiraceae bacterium]
MSRALIAMSGGVDSSVAAACMLKRGFDCIGITMKLYDNQDIGIQKGTCCSLNDTLDARHVCDRLGIDFYVNNFSEDFKTHVIDPFLEAYSKGRTPNPCINCNRYLKFDRLFKRAGDLGCDCIVTGHYARVIHNPDTGEYELHKGVDEKKDQSYVLYMLSQEQLMRTVLPIGEMKKEETRLIADEYGFVNAHKADSQDICFIPDGDFRGFLQREGIEGRAGYFLSESGDILGEHTGICNYTIGQRKGLGIAAEHPWYVKEIRPETNEVVLAENRDLFGKELEAGDLCWTYAGGLPPADEFRCKARIRYHHKEADSTVYVIGDRIKVVFDEPQRAITPGQAVVLYDDTRVLGGGTII